MGIIVTVAGIIRTWFIYKSLITTYDNTWNLFWRHFAQEEVYWLWLRLENIQDVELDNDGLAKQPKRIQPVV
ncbi:hypothetical protein N0V94_000021 [Neodidymelliopsis sp. IMI 364377]|nr:hypothetical protein N0V94_000021 [Neodidymelliopsis sp. IMI 364377]